MSKSSLKHKAYKEIKAFYLIALYLFVVFSLFVLYKSEILAEEHISFAFHGFALINAFALAKVVLVARHLHLGERFNDAPLIYPTTLKSALFTILLACCKILEDIAVGHFHGKSFQESISDLGGGTYAYVNLRTWVQDWAQPEEEKRFPSSRKRHQIEQLDFRSSRLLTFESSPPGSQSSSEFSKTYKHLHF